MSTALAEIFEAGGYPVIAGILASVVAIFVILTSLTKTPAAMKPDEFQKFKLTKRVELNHDTRLFTFALQTPTTVLGLPVGQHISLRFKDKDGKNHQRSYTPVTGDETLGEVTFIIKVYKANVHPKFPLGGKMSQHLDSLKLGEDIEMRGPKGHLSYLGRGKFTVKQMRKPLQERSAKHFGFIAGGTGITPVMQVVKSIFRDTKDTSTTMSVLYANQTEEDILLRSELELLEKEYPTRFKVHYTLDRPPAKGWNYSTGFIDKDMLEKSMPKAAPDGSSQILMCGPPPMIKFACLPNLEALGFKSTDHFTF
jgi:cytochrome-b5 reductase